MKPKSYSILLDIYKGVLNNNQLIEFTTGDNGQSVLEFILLEDKITAYNLDGCIVRMVIEGQQQDCTIVDAPNGKVKIVLLQSMFSRPGNVMAEIQIYDSSDQTLRLTTPRFQYNVRKSLMNNTTVQADPNYSILQNMILEVSSADEVAKQAKKTAESAMTTANQAESKANQIMDNGNYAKEQGDYAKAEGDRLQGMLTLDGAPKTKFDFIKNKVVQDGLVFAELGKVDTPVDVVKKNISVCMILNLSTSESSYVNHGLFPTANFFTYKNKIKLKFKKPDQTYSDGEYSINFTEGMHKLELRIVDNTIQAFVDGIALNSPQPIYPLSSSEKIATCYISGNPMTKSKSIGVFINENKILAPQEIAHNLSALNNSPSIKELSTTDSTGKTSILKLASDEDHVEMASGRTLREEYMGVLKAMGKEVPSADGSPVKVPNGIEARVINAEIKGQTVKNEFYALPNNIRFSNGMMVLSGSISGVQQQQKESTFNKCIGILKPNTVYSVVLDVIETNYTQPMVFGVGNTVDIDVSTTGIKVGKFTTPSSVTGDTLITLQNKVADQVAGRKIAFKFGFYEGDLTIKNPIKSPKFGLSSTQAIISNNCEPYPIYANEEDETNKKVISLGGVGDVQDTLEILEDGSVVLTDIFDRVTLDGSEDEKWSLQGANRIICPINGLFGGEINTTNCICDTINSSSWNTLTSKDNQNLIATINDHVGIGTGFASTEQELRQKLQANPIAIIFKKKIPTTTHIPKELIPAILTHKTNILDVGGAVKPSSFKVTVPVDKLAEIEARLQALESTTVDVVLNK